MNVLIVTIDATIVRKGPINFVLSVILLIFGIIKLSVLKMLVLLINGIIILFVKIVLLDAIHVQDLITVIAKDVSQIIHYMKEIPV
jgi:hypothetical protein